VHSDERSARWVLLVSAISCACAEACTSRVSSGDAKAEVRPEGNERTRGWFFIGCPDKRTTCTDTAALLCPGGYLVVNAIGEQVAASLAGLPQVKDGELRVRCVASFFRDGR
jgi:hypothetical protein